MGSISNLNFSFIEYFIEAREIQHVVHFTRISNIPNILEHGLLGRVAIQQRGIEATINDQYRFDYLPDAICCSISYPNYLLFYRMRCNHPDDDWAVIRLRPDILWNRQCVFCPTNAATRDIAQGDFRTRMDLTALEAMFGDADGQLQRNTLDIPDNYTTNPQAEVLVLEPIGTDTIIDVLFDRKDRVNDMAEIKGQLRPFKERFQFLHGPDYFYPRKDYKHW